MERTLPYSVRCVFGYSVSCLEYYLNIVAARGRMILLDKQRGRSAVNVNC